MQLTNREKRQYLIAFRGGKCEHCGIDYALEFDHLDRHTKSFNIGYCDRKLEDLIYEAMKCRLLCRACHKKRTKLQRKTMYRNPTPAQRLRRRVNNIMDNWKPNVFPK